MALQPLGTDIYVRHLSFSSLAEIKRYITSNVPRHLYYSSARYQEPGNPVVDEKNWLGSDLIFDIDANEIPECLENQRYIQFRFCRCGFTTDQQELKICPRCGYELKKFEHIDNECIKMAKRHVTKLMDVLKEDFGFTNVIVSFSGHRGFHVVVELDEEYRKMGSEDRREIVTYIKLDDDLVKHVLDKLAKTRHYVVLPPKTIDGGLRRRIALSLINYVSDEIKAYILGLKHTLTFIEAQKAHSELMKNLNNVVRDIAVAIDTKVTIDVTHLVRVPNSVNGKTGWKAIHIKNMSIDAFELSSQELAISDAKIKIKFLARIPEITVIDSKFQFTKDDEVVLEYPYASYFIFKEIATAINIVR